MKKLLIDSRVRKVEYEYLSKYFDVIKIPLSDDVYEEISGHSDIFYCRLHDKIICAPNAPIIEKEFIVGKNLVGRTYPYDVSYNACQIGDFIIGSQYTDSMISTNITVKQGYTKCSICVTSKNSCITSDRGIDKILKENGINSAFIEENNIKLFQFIGTAGYITNLYGTGRPESGSEHILAKEIEKRVNIPHGISVSVGIIIMSIIQEQYNNNIVKSIMKLGILDKGKSYGLNLKTIADSLNNVKQRKDRYTIINRICSINNINGVLEKFENIIKENKVDLN